MNDMAGQTILDELVKDEAFYFRNNASKTSEDKKVIYTALRPTERSVHLHQL